jgi:arabinogalactan endo-1,4-beta-galactosidase
MVMDSLRSQGTVPDMVQVGNEINHGMIWPDGSIRHPDSLAALIYAGIRGVKNVDPGLSGHAAYRVGRDRMTNRISFWTICWSGRYLLT